MRAHLASPSLTTTPVRWNLRRPLPRATGPSFGFCDVEGTGIAWTSLNSTFLRMASHAWADMSFAKTRLGMKRQHTARAREDSPGGGGGGLTRRWGVLARSE